MLARRGRAVGRSLLGRTLFLKNTHARSCSLFLAPRAELKDALCGEANEDCQYPDSVPSALREVGHFETPDKVAIDLEEFTRVMKEAAADRLENFESRLKVRQAPEVPGGVRAGVRGVS